MSQKKPLVMPRTLNILSEMGNNIKLARLRRNLSVQLVAERAGISRSTLWLIEKGSPQVSIGAYAAVLNAIGRLDAELLKICHDDVLGRTLQDLRLPIRKRASQEGR